MGTTNTQKQFSLLFEVSYKAGYCQCSIRSQPVVQFRALRGQVESCRNNEVISTNACWEAYKRGRATKIVVEAKNSKTGTGALAIAYHRPEKNMETRFRVTIASRIRCHQCWPVFQIRPKVLWQMRFPKTG